MIKYGTKLYRCVNCGIQTTEDPEEFIKNASAFSCVQGKRTHNMLLLTKEDDNVVQEMSEVQSGQSR